MTLNKASYGIETNLTSRENSQAQDKDAIKRISTGTLVKISFILPIIGSLLLMSLANASSSTLTSDNKIDRINNAVNSLIVVQSQDSEKVRQQELIDQATEKLVKQYEGKYYLKQGIAFTNNGDIEGGKQSFLKAKDALESVEATDSLNYVLILTGIGGTERLQGNYVNAISTLNDALTLSEGLETFKPMAQTAVYMNLALLNTEIGEYDEAMNNHNKAFALSEQADKLFAKNPRVLATHYNNIGLLHYYSGRFQEALKEYQTAKRYADIAEDEFLSSKVLNNMGITYDAIGNTEKGLEYSLMAIKDGLLDSHPHDKALSYINIGSMYAVLGDYGQSELYLRDALFLLQKHEPNHPNISLVYNQLGSLKVGQQKWQEALDYYNKAEQLGRKALGQYYRTEWLDKSNIGLVKMELGQLDEAEDIFDQVLNVIEQPDHKADINTSSAYSNIATLKLYQDDLDGALIYYKKSLMLDKQNYGEHHSEVAYDYDSIGYVYYLQNDLLNALLYETKALNSIDTAAYQKPDTLYSIYDNLQMIYDDMGDSEQAEKYVLLRDALSNSL